jgi:hypothetical protein
MRGRVTGSTEHACVDIAAVLEYAHGLVSRCGTVGPKRSMERWSVHLDVDTLRWVGVVEGAHLVSSVSPAAWKLVLCSAV